MRARAVRSEGGGTIQSHSLLVPIPKQRVPPDVLGTLADTALALEQTGWAAELVDPEWRLMWVSDELRALAGAPKTEQLGLGEHLLVSRLRDGWRHLVPHSSRLDWLQAIAPFMAYDHAEGLSGLVELLPADRRAELDGIKPVAPPTAWSLNFRIGEGKDSARAQCVAARLHGPDAKLAGTAFLYGSSLPATLLNLVARGDEGMFGRMARLIEPSHRAAAILFADVVASGTLSRELSSAAFFAFISSVTTAFDQTVIDHGGIVGKHAGDGVTAFFLADDFPSPAWAAHAAMIAAQALLDAVHDAARDSPGGHEVAARVGLHWGDRLFMGQIVTGGRLEVTALGDAVNEGARIEQTASPDSVLASRALIEQLDDQGAQALGLDRDNVTYCALAGLEGASKKTIRDAGTVAVTTLGHGIR